MKKMFYFSERQYFGTIQEKDLNAIEYWSKVLGKESIELIKETYGMSLEDILFREYNVEKLLDTAILEKLEIRFFDDKNERGQLVSETNNIVFYEFAQHFTKLGKRIFYICISTIWFIMK